MDNYSENLAIWYSNKDFITRGSGKYISGIGI